MHWKELSFGLDRLPAENVTFYTLEIQCLVTRVLMRLKMVPQGDVQHEGSRDNDFQMSPKTVFHSKSDHPHHTFSSHGRAGSQ